MSKKLKWKGRGSIKSAMSYNLTLLYLAAAAVFFCSRQHLLMTPWNCSGLSSYSKSSWINSKARLMHNSNS